MNILLSKHSSTRLTSNNNQLHNSHLFPFSVGFPSPFLHIPFSLSLSLSSFFIPPFQSSHQFLHPYCFLPLHPHHITLTSTFNHNFSRHLYPFYSLILCFSSNQVTWKQKKIFVNCVRRDKSIVANKFVGNACRLDSF